MNFNRRNEVEIPDGHEVKKVFFRARSYEVVCRKDQPNHASWYSFTDEVDVRNKWWNVKPGDVIVDAGSAYGSYAMAALVMGAEKIFCWSPEQDEYMLFTASLDLNGWLRKVVVRRDGLWSRPGAVVPYSFERPTSFHEHARDAAAEAAGYVRRRNEMMPRAFPVSTIDNVVLYEHEAAKVDWLKVDVEGAEVEVIKGASELITRFKPKILVENHLFKDPSMKENVEALIKLLVPSYVEVGTMPYHLVSHSLYESR